MGNEKVMENELYKAAVEGNESFITRTRSLISNDEYFLRKTSQQNNIVHVAVRHERLDFTRKALRRFPELICESNSYNNTPLHIAAETGNISIVELIVGSYKDFIPREEGEGRVQPKPWRVQNKQGNTPLHVALIHGKLTVAMYLVEEDPELVHFCNNFEETPLHLAVKHRVENDKQLVIATMKLLTNTRGASLTTKGCPLEESSLPLVEMLLLEDSSVACWPDANGLTPLLRAASMNPTYIQAIHSIVLQCPQSAEVCDRSGNTILHILISKFKKYQDAKELLRKPELGALKNVQDFAGNTPAHIAVKKHDICMVQVLLELSANFSIKNQEGISAADLVQQLPDFQDLLIPKEKDVGIILQEIGETPPLLAEEHDAVKQGNVDFLKEKLEKLGKDFFQAQVPGRGNVLDRIITLNTALLERDDVQEFIVKSLDCWPFLICETDTLGYNPLHSLASRAPHMIDRSLLQMYDRYFQKVQEEAGTEELYSPPWRMKNGKGNTPLHEALSSPSAEFSYVKVFLAFDPEIAAFKNNNKQNPLHLLSKVPFSEENIKDMDIISKFITIAQKHYAAFEYDVDGLTPLLKAAADDHLQLVKQLCTHWPNSAKWFDPNGRTFWHLLANRAVSENSSYEVVREVLKNPKLLSLLYKQDNDGNTALHLAIEKGNFRFAQFCIETTTGKGVNILDIRNNKDVTPGDLIGSAQHLPQELEQFLWSNPQVVQDMLGVRSLSGVPTPLIKDYINTIGVIAALLATITFTAAFTVPGGSNGDNGMPILMGEVAFQVFLVSDILAMCLSMMVLFCLLWIMTLNDRKKSVVLLDLTVFLLEASFYATLLTFMTGLYVTTFPIIPWIAILTCVMCSLLILLMHKSFITALIPGFIRTFVWSRNAYLSVGQSIHKIGGICCHTNQNNEGRNDNLGRGESSHTARSIGLQQQALETANGQAVGSTSSVLASFGSSMPRKRYSSVTESMRQVFGKCCYTNHNNEESNFSSCPSGQSIAMLQQPQERAHEQAGSGAKALAPPSNVPDFLIIGSPPTSAVMPPSDVPDFLMIGPPSTSAVMPPTDVPDFLIIGSPPTSAHMITIDGPKDDGGSTSGSH